MPDLEKTPAQQYRATETGVQVRLLRSDDPDAPEGAYLYDNQVAPDNIDPDDLAEKLANGQLVPVVEGGTHWVAAE